jgi:LacI family transcriptional regulator, repressor for deo operon, udp, cdd, tsx, nupC, and nupG
MEQLLELPEGPPDAVFCYTTCWRWAIRALLTWGIRVPDDVAVVGFDDIVAGRYKTPSLTTISPDKATIAQLAVDRLIARLDIQVNHEPAELWAPHELVVRECTTG